LLEIATMMAGVRPLTTIIQYAKNLQNMANDGPKKKEPIVG
jgi:hypothetical protein